MNLALTRTRFRENAITTAGPHQILTMLYDRLVLDLDRAEAAQRAGERAQANGHLEHAQDIVAGLSSNLDVEAWGGGKGLMDVYMFLMRELVSASLTADPDKIAACSKLVVPLREAWHEAAAVVAAEQHAFIPTQRTRARAFGEPAVGGELGVG
jgi:flagellar secretion chaperone FliS